MKAKKIIITNHASYCGGTLVLSTLCCQLRSLGYDAKLLLLPYFPRSPFSSKEYMQELWRYSWHMFKRAIVYKLFGKHHRFSKYRVAGKCSYAMDGIKFQYFPIFNKENTIVIYPEDVYGNPLGAKHVVRWLLYFYDYENDEKAYNKDDMFIAYREFFTSPKLNPNNYIVHQNYFDSNLYRQYNFGERSGKCYIIYKGKNRKDLPSTFDGPVFNKGMEEKELVKMLNSHKYCYSYDTQTFYNTIAAVCGCIPIVVMEHGKTEKDYLGSGEKHLGKAYGDTPEQIQYAIDTRDEMLKRLDFSERNRTNALHLIELLSKRFGAIKKNVL